MLTEVLQNGTAAPTLSGFPPSRGGQDRHHRPQPGRLVHRLHAAAHRRGVDGRPERRGRDDQRRRARPGVRRGLSREDLARVHAGRVRDAPADSTSRRPTSGCTTGRASSTSRAAASRFFRRNPLFPTRLPVYRAPIATPSAVVTPTEPTAVTRPEGSRTPRFRPRPSPGHRRPRRRRRRTHRPGPDMSADELEALLLVQEHDIALDRLRHRREALPERAELGRARRRAARARGRSAPTVGERHRVGARGRAPHRRRSPIGRRPRRRGEQAPVLGHDLVAARAPGDAGRHRHAAPAPLRPRRRGARGDGAARDARRRARARSMRRSRSLTGDGRAVARRRSPRPRPRSTTRSPRETARPGRARQADRRVAARRLRTPPRAEPGAGAARLVGHDVQACHLTIPSTEAEQIRRARRQRGRRTATTAARSSSRDAALAVRGTVGDPSRRDPHLLRRRLAREPRAVGDRRGRARRRRPIRRGGWRR